jgi:hypothetical protein
MSSIAPSQHAAAIVAHYLKHLTERSGLRWTDANDADMQTLASLLDQADAAPELDSIPPFRAAAPPQLDTRVTQVFERDGNDAIPDPAFQKWRGQQRYSEDDDVRRLVRR